MAMTMTNTPTAPSSIDDAVSTAKTLASRRSAAMARIPPSRSWPMCRNEMEPSSSSMPGVAPAMTGIGWLARAIGKSASAATRSAPEVAT